MRATITLSACCFILVASLAHAASPDSAPSVRVRYGDLNLLTVEGVHALYVRIRSAAREVCGSEHVLIRDLQASAQAKACEKHAVSNAVHAVDNVRLAAMYARLRRG